MTDINRFSTSDQLKPQFSVYLSPIKEEDGSITFGGYDVARYAKKGSTDADIFWSSTYDGERYWTVPMIGAMYDKEFLIKPTTTTGVAPLSDLDARYAILDTGVSYSLIPSRDYIKIQQTLEDGYGVKCTDSGSSSLVSVSNCECESFDELPNI